MSERERALTLAALLTSLAIALAAVAAHAHLARSRDAEGRAARLELVHLTGLADLALSSSQRWTRSPMHAEPAAALADAPGALDVDPAGLGTRPPAFADRGVTLEVRRR